MDSNSLQVGHLVRELRSSVGETQVQFAQRIKVAVATLIRYETGVQKPKASTLKSLSELARRKGLVDLATLLRQAQAARLEEATLLRLENQRRNAETLKSEREGVRQQGIEKLLVECSDDQGEMHPHWVLWHSALSQLEMPYAGFHNHLAAMVLGLFAVESYIHYLRRALAPHPQSQEPAVKSNCWDELRFLTESNEIALENLQPLWTRATQLESIRNQLLQVTPVNSSAPHLTDWLKSDVDSSGAWRVLSELEALVEQLHRAFRERAPSSLTMYALTKQDQQNQLQSIVPAAETTSNALQNLFGIKN